MGVTALHAQEHGRAAVLARLSEPRHDGACGAAVVRCEILYTRCTAAREIQQVFVVAAAHIDEQEHAVRPLGDAAHAIEARAHAAAAAQLHNGTFHLPIPRYDGATDVELKKLVDITHHGAA